MATVIDKARTAAGTEACARDAFTQPTPRTFPRAFGIEQSVVDGTIDGETPPTPVAQSAYPIFDFAAFWLAKVAATERF